MKIKKFLIFSLCALGAAAFGFTACGDGDEVSEYLGNMKSSADRAAVVEAAVTLTDSDITVYSFTRRIEVDKETRTASVADTKVTLSENFEEVTSATTVSAENVTGETLTGINLSSALVTEYSISDGDLTATVAKDKISEVLKKTVSASSDMTISVDFENGNLVKAEYSYINASSRTVNVTVTYGY